MIQNEPIAETWTLTGGAQVMQHESRRQNSNSESKYRNSIRESVSDPTSTDAHSFSAIAEGLSESGEELNALF